MGKDTDNTIDWKERTQKCVCVYERERERERHCVFYPRLAKEIWSVWECVGVCVCV